MDRTALVVGASGIIGSHAARELIADGWPVYGLARQPPGDVDGMIPVAADLLDPASLAAALTDVAPTHVFLTSWMRNATEAENIRVNGGDGPQRAAGAGAEAQRPARRPGDRPEALSRARSTATRRRACCRRRRCARSSHGWTSRISTMPRRTRSMPRPPATASPGASIARTR